MSKKIWKNLKGGERKFSDDNFYVRFITSLKILKMFQA